jgi:hypothetical protein
VITVTGRCGIPAIAKAVAVNVTVVGTPQTGLVVFFPGNAQVPNTSTLSFSIGQTRANNAVLMLASSGTGTLAVKNTTSSLPVQLLLDVTGYFQ